MERSIPIEFSLSGSSCPSLGPTRGAGVASVDLHPGSILANILRCDELAHDDEWRENLSSSGTVGLVDARRDDNGVGTHEKQVWQLRTLLPDLPGESAVASPDSPALRGTSRNSLLQSRWVGSADGCTS